MNKKIEYIIYILLGIATTTLLWLLFTTILILQSSPTILKDTLGSIVTILSGLDNGEHYIFVSLSGKKYKNLPPQKGVEKQLLKLRYHQ